MAQHHLDIVDSPRLAGAVTAAPPTFSDQSPQSPRPSPLVAP